LRREKKARENGAVLGWDESNFLRLQSMLGGAGGGTFHAQWPKCIDFVPKFDLKIPANIALHAAHFYKVNHCKLSIL